MEANRFHASGKIWPYRLNVGPNCLLRNLLFCETAVACADSRRRQRFIDQARKIFYNQRLLKRNPAKARQAMQTHLRTHWRRGIVFFKTK